MKSLVILALLVALVSCSRPSSYVHHIDLRRSPELLGPLMQQWHEATPPISEAELARQSDTVRTIYEIFRMVFDSLHSSVGPVPIGGAPTFRYTFIQQRVPYFIMDSLPAGWSYPRHALQGAVNDFRPNVSRTGSMVVYINDTIDSVLTTFLSSDYLQSNSATYEHGRYLRQFIPFKKTSFGLTWNFATPPGITRVLFDSTLQRARVECFLGSSVYREILIEKRGGRWVILDQITSIIDF